MKLNIYDSNNKLVNEFKNPYFVIVRLLGFLIHTYVIKTNEVQRITHKYNGNDTLSIKCKLKLGTIYEFADLPTSHSTWIDEDAIMQTLKGGE